MHYIILLICLFSASPGITGQEAGMMVVYTPDFRFRDGIFLNFNMVKRNAPVPKNALLIAEDYIDTDFFRRILTAEEIRFRDESGSVEVIRREEVFAFSVDGKLSIMYRERFSREVLIGQISLFTFSKQRYYGAFYRSAIDERPEEREIHPAGGDVKDYERIKYRGSNTCLLDFTTGKVLKLNRRNLGLLLSRDKSISDEYMSLSKRWSKAQMF